MSRPPSQPAAEGEMETPAEIAKRYRVSERHITDLATRGEIPGLKIGSVWRFDPVEVREAFATRSRTIRQPRKGTEAK